MTYPLPWPSHVTGWMRSHFDVKVCHMVYLKWEAISMLWYVTWYTFLTQPWNLTNVKPFRCYGTRMSWCPCLNKRINGKPFRCYMLQMLWRRTVLFLLIRNPLIHIFIWVVLDDKNAGDGNDGKLYVLRFP